MRRRKTTLSPSRRAILRRLEKSWARFPSLRLCQLIENAVNRSGADRCMYYVADAELAKKLEDYCWDGYE